MQRSPSVYIAGCDSEAKTRLAHAVARLARLELVERDVADSSASFADPRARVVLVDPNATRDRALRLRLLEHGVLVQMGACTAADYEAHVVVSPVDLDVETAAESLVALASTAPIAVALGERTYCVEIAAGHAESRLEEALRALGPTRVVAVTDDVVGPLVVPRLARAFDGTTVNVTIPSGEKHKTLATVERILTAAIEAPVDRRAVVVGIGGGVVTDITGLAAALALRGLRWIAVPTTLLAMVDASVGGKTAVDLGSAKNAVGAFHQPARVIVDPSFTQTETPRAFRSGLAEVVKTALIGDADLYREMLTAGSAERLVADRDLAATTRAIRSSVLVKAGVVGRDEKEAGERAHLNLGHTIGHALEAEGKFERLTHGEAVALGMVAALRIGARLGVTPPELETELASLLRRLGLPTELDREPLSNALRWVGYDKKRSGKVVRAVLVREPGKVEVVPIVPSDLPRLLAS